MGFYCQKMCGGVDFSIKDWNEAHEMCNRLGLSEQESNRILFPETDGPCKEQCFNCMAIVGDRQLKTKQLLSTIKNDKERYLSLKKENVLIIKQNM